MEEVPSVKLDERWTKFDTADHVATVMTAMQRPSLNRCAFPASGAYFKEDVSTDLHNVSSFFGCSRRNVSSAVGEVLCRSTDN